MPVASDPPPPSAETDASPSTDAEESSPPSSRPSPVPGKPKSAQGVEPTRSAPFAAASTDGGLFEWVTRRGAIAAAEAAYREASETQREMHRRARLALEVGERADDPIDPLRTGSGAPFALEAYRQSLYWSLALVAEVSGDAHENITAADRFRRALPHVRAALPPRSEERIASILDRSFVQEAAEPDASLVADAALLHEAAVAVVRHTEGPQARIAEHRRVRTRRSLLALVAALGVLVLLISFGKVALRKPDLAKNKPWRASSSWGECTPEKHACGPISPTEIFFHTNDDASPWVEIDLGAPTSFSSLTIKNRSDCCGDRAVPLVVEVASEPDKWKEIAKRTQVFDTWEPQFAAQNARWVRLRVTRKSWLHLEKFAVHR